MDKFIIEGEHRLQGEVRIQGAKNAALPIFASTLLFPEEYVIHNVPLINDVFTMIEILKFLGTKVKIEGHTAIVNTKYIDKTFAPYELVSKMRASFLVTGALIGRFGEACVAKPGGCAIGIRSIDEHLHGFSKLGCEMKEEHGYITLKANKLKGNKIYLSKKSVTATENLIIASVRAEDETEIINAAKEPHVRELINFLNSQGCNIKFDDEKIIIKSVKNISPKEYTIGPDYNEADTFMVATAITGGDVFLENARWEDSIAEINKLTEIGVKINKYNNGIRVKGNKKLRSCNIVTAPYPGFPTDLQPQITALLAIADGTSIIEERMYEQRFTHVLELNRMGANIEIIERTAIINGVKKLSGTDVIASDIRAGAGLVIAGLSAEGKTTVHRVYHIDRGYEKLEEKLNSIGAKIQRIS